MRKINEIKSIYAVWEPLPHVMLIFSSVAAYRHRYGQRWDSHRRTDIVVHIATAIRWQLVSEWDRVYSKRWMEINKTTSQNDKSIVGVLQSTQLTKSNNIYSNRQLSLSHIVHVHIAKYRCRIHLFSFHLCLLQCRRVWTCVCVSWMWKIASPLRSVKWRSTLMLENCGNSSNRSNRMMK